MIYIKYKGNKVVKTFNEKQLKEEFPEVEFPDEISDEFLEKLNCAKLEDFPTPKDLKEDKYNKLAFEFKKVRGKWTREVVLVPVPENEVESRYTKAADKVRARRDELLAETDWTQLRDVDVKTSRRCQEYRKKLRDITEQPNFPFHVEFPSAPLKKSG